MWNMLWKEKAYTDTHHPRSNHVVKICFPSNYEVTDFSRLTKLEITFELS